MVMLSDVAGELRRSGLLVHGATTDVVVSDAHVDSRQSNQDSLFCCVVGANADGHDHAPEAVGRGARALIVSRLVDVDVPQLVVDESSMRRATAEAAALIHGHPSREIPVVGITGTNGKTTTAAMLGSICSASGMSPEIFGTLTGARTTPESTELQRSMRRAVDAGRRIIIMEVTSHALALDRTHGIAFRAAVYTNLGHDHLDFHGSLDAYFEAKARLFEEGVAADSVVNRDDIHGRRLIDRIANAGRAVTTYGIDDAAGLVESMTQSVFAWNGIEVVLPIGGRHNVYNALAAATTARLLAVDNESIAAGLSQMGTVPGRMQPVDVAAPFSVYVDYAHTPDSLEAVLSAVRAITATARLIVVFGCGGDRDTSKRALMGEVASRIADVVIVTTDNSRSEDPATIARQVLSGAKGSARTEVELDRRLAIRMAVETAGEGDVIVIAGKGHERGQTIGTVTHDFDDLVEARYAIQEVIGGDK